MCTRLFFLTVTILHFWAPSAPSALQPEDPNSKAHSIRPRHTARVTGLGVSRSSSFPTPRTPALKRLGHEVLPGFPLPAEQQHQPRYAAEQGHGGHHALRSLKLTLPCPLNPTTGTEWTRPLGGAATRRGSAPPVFFVAVERTDSPYMCFRGFKLKPAQVEYGEKEC